jgi:hypothetical protein
MGQDPRGFARGPSRPDYVRPDEVIAIEEEKEGIMEPKNKI